MCGRFTLTVDPAVLAEHFAPAELAPGLHPHPRYNIAPTQPVVAVRSTREGRRRLDALRWGLIPHWAKDPSIGARMINARAETVAEKPAFRAALRRRRCLVAADGFFEWQRTAGQKRPHWIRRRDGAVLAFAGLWERWGEGEERVDSCTIVTTEASALLRPVHGRMPLVLAPGDYDSWLEREQPPNAVQQLLRPPALDEALEVVPVGSWVNSPANDDPRCIAVVER